MITAVEVHVSEKVLRKLPKQIINKLFYWAELVREDGLEHARKVPGYHDEPLKGMRTGQRSIRLSRSYRAIYVVREGAIACVEVIEVNKHEY